MDMLSITRAELESHQALSPTLNAHTQQVVDSIVFDNVQPRMKAVIATSQITSFASQFRRKILLPDDTQVPINAISFVFAPSGAGKDSAVNAARKCFADGYAAIAAHITETEKQRAITAAEDAGEKNPQLEFVYKQYMKPIPPIDIAPTTGPGLIQHINDMAELSIGSNFLYTGEFSDELAYNQDMMENIKVISETYDLGNKDGKYTKSADHRSQSIRSQSTNALFIGSPGHILYDPVTRKKFEIAFMSKLARRSWFGYFPEQVYEPDFSSHPNPLKAMLDYDNYIETTARKARDVMALKVRTIAAFGISTAGHDITLDPDVWDLFRTYKRYNSEIVTSLPSQDTTYALIRRHLQWKALKLAGAFAIFDCSDTIQLSHYIDAIRFAELLDQDMELFEHDLNKAPHERFADYIRTLVDNTGKASISVHDIKKLGYITTVSIPKLQELVTLCSGYDTTGIFKIDNEGGAISYESIIKSDILGVSYKPINTTALNAAIATGDAIAIRDAKHNISITTAYGFDTLDCQFDQLGELLADDFAYSPFKFRNGVRGKDSIQGGTKWVVLDVDVTTISASEIHFLLSDINHYVALSSDPNNEYKYRVILELDSIVELDASTWKHFVAALAEDLAIKVDPLPQSQIFFSYAGRPVLTTLDAAPLPTRKYLILAHETTANKTAKQATFSPAHNKALLADPLTTFHYAFEAPIGEGSRQMIRAAYYSQHLGASLEYTLDLLSKINEYWISPMEHSRFEKLLDQVRRLY